MAVTLTSFVINAALVELTGDIDGTIVTATVELADVLALTPTQRQAYARFALRRQNPGVGSEREIDGSRFDRIDLELSAPTATRAARAAPADEDGVDWDKKIASLRKERDDRVASERAAQADKEAPLRARQRRAETKALAEAMGLEVRSS